MENRPVGRTKRVVSGGSGIKRSGSGLGKNVSARNVKKGNSPGTEAKKPLFGGLFKNNRGV